MYCVEITDKNEKEQKTKKVLISTFLKTDYIVFILKPHSFSVFCVVLSCLAADRFPFPAANN